MVIIMSMAGISFLMGNIDDKYTGLQRVVGGWNDRQNDDSLALSLCVSVIDPQFFVVLQLYFCPTNIFRSAS